MTSRFSDKAKVDSEAIRKAKHLLEVYGEIQKPLVLTGTCRLLVSGMHVKNGWVTLNQYLYRWCQREIQLKDNIV